MNVLRQLPLARLCHRTLRAVSQQLQQFFTLFQLPSPQPDSTRAVDIQGPERLPVFSFPHTSNAVAANIRFL